MYLISEDKEAMISMETLQNILLGFSDAIVNLTVAHVGQREINAKEKALLEIMYVECRMMFWNYIDSASLCIYGISLFAIWCLWEEIEDRMWACIIFLAQFTFIVASNIVVS